jgi:hypothetical protein
VQVHVRQGCLNVFGMAVNLTEAPFHRSLRWIPGEGQDGYPCRIPGILILNISSQNSYAVFCFSNRGLNSAMRRDGATVRPRPVMAAARGKQVALGQTASAAYAGRRTRGGPAASGFAGSLAVHVWKPRPDAIPWCAAFW